MLGPKTIEFNSPLGSGNAFFLTVSEETTTLRKIIDAYTVERGYAHDADKFMFQMNGMELTDWDRAFTVKNMDKIIASYSKVGGSN
jgi:hypothetical protein